jgi:hypothetical protein
MVTVVEGRVLCHAQQPVAQIAGALSQNPARRYPFAHVQLRAGQATRRVSVERRAFLRGGADESLLPQMPHTREHISKPGRRQARESQSRATTSSINTISPYYLLVRAYRLYYDTRDI